MPRAAVHSADDSMPCVVVDNGSAMIKAGFAGEEEPRVLLPSRGLDGTSAAPVSRGVIQDWDAMEAYWDHAFGQLGIDTEQANLLITSPLFDTKDNKERLMQTLFETFAAPGVYTCAPAVFELYAAGRENGVIVGCGAQCTYALLVHEGLPDPRTLTRSDVAGEALTAHAAGLLTKAAGGSAGGLDSASAAKAKEALAVVAADASGAPLPDVKGGDTTYALPDGKKLTVSGATRAAMGEPLFSPMLCGEQSGGLAQLVADSIRSRDRDGALESTEHGKDGTGNWYRSVVIAGGSTLIPGVPSRLQRELGRYAPDGCTPEVLALPERGHAAWIGGSILASLAVMGQMWISKEEYDDNGPLIVHRKCF